jgi:hypothetical protein
MVLTYDAGSQQFRLSTGKGSLVLSREQVLNLIGQASDALVAAARRA